VQQSNFTGARRDLERAFIALYGKDEFSVRAREALGLLIDACAKMEFTKMVSADNVMRFPSRTMLCAPRCSSANDSKLSGLFGPLARAVPRD
jgi:hypothetical protein